MWAVDLLLVMQTIIDFPVNIEGFLIKGFLL